MNMATFDVAGTWTGTASDDDSQIKVTLMLDNNGGRYGMELSGELELDGIGTFPFQDSFVDPSAGASRVAEITASDDKGYKYTLRGEFTNKRMDQGQLESTNPAVGVDSVFLDINLMKAE